MVNIMKSKLNVRQPIVSYYTEIFFPNSTTTRGKSSYTWVNVVIINLSQSPYIKGIYTSKPILFGHLNVELPSTTQAMDLRFDAQSEHGCMLVTFMCKWM
jgi:hypothetical protein